MYSFKWIYNLANNKEQLKQKQIGSHNISMCCIISLLSRLVSGPKSVSNEKQHRRLGKHIPWRREPRSCNCFLQIFEKYSYTSRLVLPCIASFGLVERKTLTELYCPDMERLPWEMMQSASLTTFRERWAPILAGNTSSTL